MKLSVHPSILLNSREWAWGTNFTPKDEVHPRGPGVMLRMALWLFRSPFVLRAISYETGLLCMIFSAFV
jgi:hypothetical protein